MDEIKNIIDDLGISALETSINIAAVAVVSDSGNLVIQTENWDLTNQTSIILNVIKGERSFILNNVSYKVVESTFEGIVASSESGMGHILFVPFQGGMLVSYALPKANPSKALSFLKNYAIKMNGKI